MYHQQIQSHNDFQNSIYEIKVCKDGQFFVTMRLHCFSPKQRLERENNWQGNQLEPSPNKVKVTINYAIVVS